MCWAVDPNRLISFVLSEVHLGQATFTLEKLLKHEECEGGAIPYLRSFSLASFDIQSVVHAGE
jgi:hypothetical protein